MTFSRSAASCCLLIAVIAFEVVATSAYRSSGASVQQIPGDRPYGGYERSYEDGASHGAYEGHEHEQYYRQEPHYEEQHSEGPYHGAQDGKHIVPICLQATFTNLIENTDITETKFRCCTPADEPDTCAYNSTDYGYQRGSHEHRDHDFMGMLGDDHAAVCKQVRIDEQCPPFVSADAECIVLQLNCTLTREATKCGCFAEKGLFFSSKVYQREVESLTCLTLDGATPATPFKAQVLYLQGAIDAYGTREGYKESEGSVEYFPGPFGNIDTVQKPYPELRWAKPEQLIVRLAEHK